MIYKDMTIEEIVEKFPQTVAPLKKMGVSCVVCGEPVWGTLEENVLNKGLSDLESIVSELNKIINESGENK